MLDANTIALIKATVPALQTHGEAITRHFYQKLFSEHPEVREFFSASHQAGGAQPRALAGAVLAYAAHIDRLEALKDALPLIIQKHVALGVQPEHYPVVGACLLYAIKDVLGDAATPAILDAWAKAYGQLADLLIAAEESVYREHASQPGGWRGPREFRVVRKVRESELITSFHFEPVDGKPIAAFIPGQYITLLLEIDGVKLRRNYSLSDAPGQRHYRISVKREPGGVASNWLHDRVNEGDSLPLLPPSGSFTLTETPRPLVLLTAGVGITPAISMLNAAAKSGRRIEFIHAALNSGAHAFREHVEQIAALHPNVQPYFVYNEALAGDTPHATGF
ncbi:MAG: NO-inducible flavohemoprotein, partial [Steroidobacteraceae bacterium]